MFDLGGVLVKNATFAALNEMLPLKLPHRELKDRWLRSEAVRNFERGETTVARFGQAFVQEWHLPISPKDFIAAFERWPEGPFPGAEDLVSRLRRNFRVGCLSNSNALHWARFADFLELFDFALSSHLTGAVKPDVTAFANALARCRIDAGSVAFFDDSLANVVAAQTCGISAFHVVGIESLARSLRREGFLT